MTTKEQPKHLHVIGICGVATSALAIAFHNRGWKVTGSDKGFYPPVSTHLTEAGVAYYAGWHPEKMMEAGKPDLVVIPTASGSQNPEVLYAREHGLNCASYTEIFRDYFIRENSIVCAGTWGKTSSTAILSFIMEEAELDPGYMFGGISLSHHSSAKMTDSAWSVFEGDEYKSGPNDPTAKFFYYKPTHLLLTAVSWDHADLYPTEEIYFKTFEKLVNQIPATGMIVACADDAGVAKVLAATGASGMPEVPTIPKPITYGKTPGADYYYHSIEHTKNGISFSIDHAGQIYRIASPMLGRFNAENFAGCFAMAHSIGVAPEKIVAAIARFKGIKRRFEKRLDAPDSKTGVTVFDCHAPTPEKAASILESLREVYDKKIIAIYEPNIGGRQKSSIDMYNNAFKNSDIALIPRLTKLKVDMSADSAAKDQPLEGPELAAFISETHPATEYIEDDVQLVTRATTLAATDDVIVFLGSHGFRGMIEEVVAKLKK